MPEANTEPLFLTVKNRFFPFPNLSILIAGELTDAKVTGSQPAAAGGWRGLLGE